MNKKHILSIERLKQSCLKIEDPRRQSGNIRHDLIDILIITLLGIICGGETWEDIAEYGRMKRTWLKEILRLENGVPGEDTLRRVFARISPKALEQVYREWVGPYVGTCMGKQIGIDGKTVRGVAKGSGDITKLHMVSAWVKEDRISLGQIRTEEKSNEITAIPMLLDTLDIQGAVVSIDAMGCQRAIAEKVTERSAQYVLAVKENQPTLHEEIAEYFAWALSDEVERKRISIYSQAEKGHGRICTRTTYVTTEIEWFEGKRDWPRLKSFIMVDRKRIVGERETTERSYYISSLEADAKQCGQLVRGHWAIENQLHWMLDVAFHEDASLIHDGHAPQNLTVLRRMAMSLLKKDTTHQCSLKTKRKVAGWDDSFASSVIAGL